MFSWHFHMFYDAFFEDVLVWHAEETMFLCLLLNANSWLRRQSRGSEQHLVLT